MAREGAATPVPDAAGAEGLGVCFVGGGNQGRSWSEAAPLRPHASIDSDISTGFCFEYMSQVTTWPLVLADRDMPVSR